MSAVLRVEDRQHPATRHLPETFRSSPSEWYRWEKDLRQNPDIDILLSIDSTSFPLGTGPKPHEIWHSGYYPVVWTNRKYRMIYLNMGHNDIDYEHKYDTTNKTLSYTLEQPGSGSADHRRLVVVGDQRQSAMTSYIGLLRAVNVGGTGKLAMTDLKLLCERPASTAFAPTSPAATLPFEN